MEIVWSTLLALLPMILFTFLLLAFVLYRFYGMKCPTCRERRLKYWGGYKWDGERSGGGVSLYHCKGCSARYKKASGSSALETPTEHEWRMGRSLVD